MYHPEIKPLYKITQVLWYLFSLLEILLLFRFLLKLLGANPLSGFANFIYSMSDTFVRPFFSIIPSPHFDGSVVEWATLFAILVYWVVVWALVELILLGEPISTWEAHDHLEEQRRNI